MASEYGHTFNAWKAGSSNTWRDYTRHAFVEGLSDGTLRQSAFLSYLVQDYIFLRHFSRAWAMAIVKSDSLDEMKTAATTVDALINHEMQLHVTTCAQHGITEETLFSAKEHPANLAYTRYVMDAGLSGDFLDLMAALAPCVFGYGEIGARLDQEKSADTPYAEWIATYAGGDYQEVCAAVGAMLDGAVTRRLGDTPQSLPRWRQLQGHFETAAQLEVDFWQMGLDAA